MARVLSKRAKFQGMSLEQIAKRYKPLWKRLPATWSIRRGYLKHNSITYQEYLASEHWQQVRRHKGLYQRHLCKLCGKSNDETLLNLHHLTYRRMGKERGDDTAWLCGDCHRIVHKWASLATKKYLAKKAQKRARKLARQTEKLKEAKRKRGKAKRLSKHKNQWVLREHRK